MKRKNRIILHMKKIQQKNVANGGGKLHPNLSTYSNDNDNSSVKELQLGRKTTQQKFKTLGKKELNKRKIVNYLGRNQERNRRKYKIRNEH